MRRTKRAEGTMGRRCASHCRVLMETESSCLLSIYEIICFPLKSSAVRYYVLGIFCFSKKLSPYNYIWLQSQHVKKISIFYLGKQCLKTYNATIPRLFFSKLVAKLGFIAMLPVCISQIHIFPLQQVIALSQILSHNNICKNRFYFY